MSRSRRSDVRAAFTLSVAFSLAGCASTTGLGWVAEAHRDLSSVIGSSSARDAAIPATAELEPAADVRPRLNHTITLGEIDVAPVERAAQDTGDGPSVTINNYNVMNGATPTYGYGYVSPGYARSVPRFSGGNAPRTSASPAAMAPGQSWPTIFDPGPSFPYRAGPASPWTRAQ